MPSAESKQYDLVLFGATGFTGSLVAQYLQTHQDKFRWALAGRSEKRLAAVRDKFSLPADVGVIIAETGDEGSLLKMAQSTRCVMNLVGPYRKYGAHKVIDACIKGKAHYVDLTGETQFVEEVIEKFHERAKQAGVVLAPSSGFDSVPSDLTTYLAVQHERARSKSFVNHANLAFKAGPIPLEPMGAFSSGTLLSFIDMGEEDGSQIAFKNATRLAGPLAKVNKPMSFYFSAHQPQYGPNAYGSSWTLGPHNIRHVYRSWALLEDQKDRYGEKFEYVETLYAGSRIFSALQGLTFYVVAFLVATFSFVRRIMTAVIPPNSGPSQKGQARMTMQAKTIAHSSASSASQCTMIARGHPGYSITAKLISEVSLTLALSDRSKLHPLAQQGGSLTAATIGADEIADRLRKNAGFKILLDEYKQG